MVRLIKRYESRKLYDTEESRYVSLDEIAEWVRGGQEIRVVDNASSEDVTAQTLAQVILGEGRDGRSRISTEVMHDLVRFGEKALSTGVEQVQQGMDRMVRASIDKLGPVRQAREEMKRLRSRLEELETSLVELEKYGLSTARATTKTARSTTTAKKKKTAKKTSAARKTKARSA
ncbi:MAG: polyhydroxyalkanoate synthesis regulator DNA-binding domain-containing protein [Thermoanaerobaculia bacterium]